MKLHTAILFICFISQIAGCASYYASRSDYNDRISKWIEKNEYTEIENSLKKLSKNHSDYKIISARKNDIKIRKQNYIKDIIHSAKNWHAQGKWQTALDIYNEALEKVENEPALLMAKKKTRRRTKYTSHRTT